MSLRAVPQVHGASRDQFAYVSDLVNRELASVTDNPAVGGTPDAPQVHSQAHAVRAGVALSMDSLSVAAAMLGAISERRIDRLINPLVSGLPAFLTHATPAALKSLAILENLVNILAIELLAAAQAYDLQPNFRETAQERPF